MFKHQLSVETIGVITKRLFELGCQEVDVFLTVTEVIRKENFERTDFEIIELVDLIYLEFIFMRSA